jgi:hypothetical protein
MAHRFFGSPRRPSPSQQSPAPTPFSKSPRHPFYLVQVKATMVAELWRDDPMVDQRVIAAAMEEVLSNGSDLAEKDLAAKLLAAAVPHAVERRGELSAIYSDANATSAVKEYLAGARAALGMSTLRVGSARGRILHLFFLSSSNRALF